jgi:hypothetical protein
LYHGTPDTRFLVFKLLIKGQANKAVKMTPRIPPKNASTFSPGNVIRLEFPAQGYMYDKFLKQQPRKNHLGV